MKAIQKIKNQFKKLFGGATSRVVESNRDGIASKALLGHGVASARRHGRGAPSTSVVTSGESSKRLAGDSHNISSINLNNQVLRHVFLLSLFKKISYKLPWRSCTNSLNTTRNYIKNFRRIRILGSASLFSLGLLLLATFVPLYNVTRTEDTEATAGTAQDSTITFTSTRSTASVDLTVTSENGTFASSTSSNQAAFSLSTTNYTGYTLTIASNTNSSTLSNGNGGTLSSISEPIDESTFNTTAYNNKWGYKPNYYNSSANSNYLQSPTTTASTLDETDAANSTAKNYTIALGARADYTNASGTYSSSNYKLMYVANPIAYSITYADNSGDSTVANIPAVQSSDSVTTSTIVLTSATPTRTGYSFKSWCLGTVSNSGTSCSGTEYNSGASFGIDRTANKASNTATLTAVWTPNQYTVTFLGGEIYTRYDNKDVLVGATSSCYVNESRWMALETNTNYTLSLDYKADGDNIRLITDYYPDTLPEQHLSATTSWQHSDWTTQSSHSDMGNFIIRIFNCDMPNNNINVKNVLLSKPTLSSKLYGNTLGALPNVSKAGFTFNGWYTAPSGGTRVYDTTAVPLGDTTYYGQWTRNSYAQNTYVRYQNADGTYGGYSLADTRSVPYDENYSYSTNGGNAAAYQTGSVGYTVTEAKDNYITIDRQTYAVDVNPVINETVYGGGLAGFTFDVYVDGVFVADDYTDWASWAHYSGGNLRYGQTIRVIANGVGGYNITAGDLSYTVTGGLDIRPTWQDNVAPVLTNWWWGEVNVNVARLYIQAWDAAGVKTVQCPTSTASGGYGNWVWFNAVWDSEANAYRCDITPATFGHYDQTYITHLYMYDNRDNGGYINQTSVAIPANWIWFQDATSANCGMTMRDNRGNATYKAIDYSTAMIDGLCWMTRNLDLPGGTTLTSSDSNVTSNYTLPVSSTSGFNDSTIAFVYNSSSTYNDTSCGNNDPCYSYYSYAAATAGINPSSGEISLDICPYGWRLPTRAEYDTLSSSYNTGAKLVASPFYGVYSGYYYVDSFYYGGSIGAYWSSTASYSNGAYYLGFDSSGANADNTYKYYRFAVRCVAKS